MWEEYQGWQANIHATINLNSTGVPVSQAKAELLASTIDKDQFYFLTLQAGFDVEIIKLIAISQKILMNRRGKKCTSINIWPAGTLIAARIPERIISELHLDKTQILSLNHGMCEAPNGDMVTKSCMSHHLGVNIGPGSRFNFN